MSKSGNDSVKVFIPFEHSQILGTLQNPNHEKGPLLNRSFPFYIGNVGCFVGGMSLLYVVIPGSHSIILRFKPFVYISVFPVHWRQSTWHEHWWYWSTRSSHRPTMALQATYSPLLDLFCFNQIYPLPSFSPFKQYLLYRDYQQVFDLWSTVVHEPKTDLTKDV